MIAPSLVSAGSVPPPLHGRRQECRTIDELVGSVRAGGSATLVLVGEAGIGKSRLLTHAADAAGDLQVARVAGVESERLLPYAGLHRLLRPWLHRMDRVAGPQRAALAAAFGLAADAPANRFLAGLATLSLLAGAAERLPLICLVDDAQWLDQETLGALAVTARRLHADGVGLLIATADEPPPAPVLEGIPSLVVAGLPDAAARDLLGQTVPGRLAPPVAARIVAETRGNPLALIELTARLSADQLAGGSPMPDRLPLSRRMQVYLLRRVRRLPAATQSLLLVAAASVPGDDAVVWRAAAILGLAPGAADPALADGILTASHGVTFRDPLVRSAVYCAAPPADRRRVHAALAQATDRAADPGRRAWHLAAATEGLDEAVATELELASPQARSNGGEATPATFLSRAADLTPDPGRRARRLLAAAGAHLAAADPVAAQRRLAQATPALHTPVLRATAHRLRAALAWLGGGLATVRPAAMLAVAEDTDLPEDVRHGALYEALVAAIMAGRHTTGTTPADVGRAALRVTGADRGPATTVRLVVEALATRLAVGYAPALPSLRTAAAAVRADRELPLVGVPFLLAGHHLIAEDLWDDHGFLAGLRQTGRPGWQRGAPQARTAALIGLATAATWSGDFQQAAAHHAEAAETGVLIGSPAGDTTYQAELLAWRGLEGPARSAADTAITVWEGQRGFGALGDNGRNCLAILELGLGRYAEALELLRPAFRDDGIIHGNRMLPNLVEAAVRAGDPATARAALSRLSERAGAAGTPWALGVLARSRALLTEDADALYHQAAEHLAGTTLATEVARTDLLHGEWLRRRKRRAEARTALQRAQDAFAAMGAAAFAERARTELLATGQRARPRTTPADQHLTPQEARVAALAAGGATNTEIATRLFITSSTVEYHLNKVFRKLLITSRRQLAHALPASSG